MASFTDNIQALSTFNPYVEQQPVEAMVKVGMQKQQQYNEGYQKIQSSIDQVAGLDIMKGVDRNYLQSQLNTLGNNLKTVAAGDFSSFQLTNSVAGMAKKIGNDSNIQNAVSATTKVRKELSRADVAKKGGKSSVQNDWDLNNQINSYLNDEQVGSAFTGQYSDYIDIDKKLREVAEKVHEVDNSIDDPFKRNADGSHILDKSGRPIVDDAMMSIKIKGKPAEKILNNFYSALNENDQNQLRIDASYHYRGATLDSFRNDAIMNTKSKKDLLTASIVDLNLELTTNPKLTAVEQNKIKAQIEDTNAILSNGTLEKSLQKELEQINSNKDPESYKYKLYTQKTLTQLAKDMSYQSYEQEYKSNPYAQMDMEKKRLQFSYDNANREQANFEARLSWDKQSHAMDIAQKILDRKSKPGEIPPITTPGRLATDVDTPSIIKLNKEIKGLDNSVTELNSIYAPMITDPSLNTPQKKKTYLDYLSRTYSTDPSVINKLSDNNLREYLEKRRALDIQRGQKQGLYAATVNHTKVYDAKIDETLGKETGVRYADSGQTFNAKQLYEFSKNLENSYKTTRTGGGGAAGASLATTVFNSKELLDKYKGTQLERLAVAAVNKYYGKPLSEADKSVLKKAQNIKLKYDPIIGKIDQQKFVAQSEFLAKRMPERQTMKGVLSSKSEVDMDLVDRLLTAKTNEFMSGGVDVRELADFNPDTINDLRSDKNVGYTIEKKYDGSATLHVSNGTKEQKVPLTASEFSAYFPNYAKTNPINEIKYNVLGSPKHTTNLKGGSDSSNAVNAYLSGYDVPNLNGTVLAPLVRFDVEGSPLNTGDDRDRFQIRMYVNNNGHWVTGILNQRDYVSEGGIKAILDQVGPTAVKDLLNKNK